MIHKLLKRIFFLLFVVIIIGLIYVGLHFQKISKKQYILSTTIQEIGNKIYQFTEMKSNYDFQDDFQVTGTFSSNLTSEEFENKSTYDPIYYQRNSLINNLSKMDTKIVLKQDKKDNKLFASIKESIGEESILDAKYYVENATKYYMINGLFDNYVNAGNSTYFETLSKENTTKDNIDYLYQLVLESIEKSIYEEEIKSYDTEVLLNENKIPVKQISVKLTDKYIKRILNRILNHIKEDEKANLILSNVCPSILTAEVDENKNYLEKNESYTFNIYVRKIWFEPIKYEIIHLKNDTQEIFTYEGNKESGLFYYSYNNEVKYTANYASSQKMIEILVFNSKNEPVGSIKVEKSSNSLTANINLNLEKKSIDLSYSKIFKKYQKNKSYLRENNLSIKIMNEDTIILNGTIHLDVEVEKKFTINEDIESSILMSTISSDQEERFNSLYDNIKTRLERE